jgi:hypothetical protein
VINPGLSTIDLMPGLPFLKPSTPFKQSEQSEHYKSQYQSIQKTYRPLSNPYRLSLIDYFYTYRSNTQYIPQRLDVAFVKTALLCYLARYIPKWAAFDPEKYNISREYNRDCARVYDGFRAVWNKWKRM